jgi:hypothetical protein
MPMLATQNKAKPWLTNNAANSGQRRRGLLILCNIEQGIFVNKQLNKIVVDKVKIYKLH